MATPQVNTFYYGDCLEVMRNWPDNWVDCIYLDPPFNSNADYNITYNTNSTGTRTTQVQAFTDTWTWDDAAIQRVSNMENTVAHPAHKAIAGLKLLAGESSMLAYISYMAERLAEMHRLLKPTGSLYLHCDPTASHYLKITLDCLFGATNFCNEITWKKTNSPKAQSTYFGTQKDIIFLYAKEAKKAIFNKVHRKHDEKSLKAYRYDDNNGRGPYQTVALSNKTSLGGFGKMRTWEWRGVTARWIYSEKTLEELWADGRIYTTKNGLYRKKQYLNEQKGVLLSDLWIDDEVNPIQGREQLYPTQKPLALLERILNASSNPGDIVLDPFCGCGTTIVAAHKLNRNWIGIDISPYVVGLIETHRFEGMKLKTVGIPTP